MTSLSAVWKLKWKEILLEAMGEGGRRKRDLLSFQEELCIQLVGNFHQTNSSLSASKWCRSVDEIPGRLHEVWRTLSYKG